MDYGKMLAILGSPGSGKTTTTIKLACALAAQKKNVIVVHCDPFTPVIPTLLPAGTVHDTSLGTLLTAPGITQESILNACLPVGKNKYLGLLGYCAGESLMHYPKVTHDKAVELFVSLRHLADYVLIDCASIFEADPASLVAAEVADGVLRMGTADLKGVSYFQSHAPMLADSRYQHGRQRMVVGNLKVGQDWETVAGQYGGIDHSLPYVVELEKQGDEMALFEPLRSAEGVRYQMGIDRIRADMFASPEEGTNKKPPLKEKIRRAVARIGKEKVRSVDGGENKSPAVSGSEDKEDTKIPIEWEDAALPGEETVTYPKGRKLAPETVSHTAPDKAEGAGEEPLGKREKKKKGKDAKDSHFLFSRNRGEF